MKNNTGPQKLSIIINNSLVENKLPKPPAYEWQDLALRVIKELNIPKFKRNSIFKVCKNNSRDLIEKCLNDTKELCKQGEKWRYFFKVINKNRNNKN